MLSGQPTLESAKINRKELIIKVPVTTTDELEFRDQVGFYSRQISKFIDDELPKFGVVGRLYEATVKALIKNSFDSIIMRELKIGESLILKIVIQEKEGKVLVKIKDNAAGFVGQAKSVVFEAAAIQKIEKNFLGLQRKSVGGLTLLNSDLRDAGGSCFFKNRKGQGATVYMQLPQNQNNKTVSSLSATQHHEDEPPSRRCGLC